ncbi:MAG: hypothetical protein ACE5EU_08195 [Paracoccaceae bacterium]
MATGAARKRLTLVMAALLKHLFVIVLAFAITCWAYLLCALLLFGGVLKPLFFFLIASDLWKSLILASLIVGACVARFALRRPGFELFHPKPFKPAFYVVGSILVAVVLSGIAATAMRRAAIIRLEPDHIKTVSFITSMHMAGREALSSVHAVALKDCVPYAWSYRKMEFYQLPNSIAVNILPKTWIDDCAIVRERRR